MLKNKMLKSSLVRVYFFVCDVLFFPPFFIAFLVLAVFSRSKRYERILFCDRPLLNNKHWSNALKSAGWDSECWTVEFFGKINKINDFDKVLTYKNRMLIYIYFLKAISRFDVFVISFYGGLLGRTIYARLEPYMLRMAAKRTIVIPFGADFYSYKEILDYNRIFTLMAVYPEFGSQESGVNRRLERWSTKADVIIPGHLIEGLERWDMLPCNPIVVDALSTPKHQKNLSDLTLPENKSKLKILHLTNHRLIKGTEYIQDVFEKLIADGVKIEYEIIEEMQNDLVHEKLGESDILIDQIYSGYALSAIEGLANQCIVLSNITRRNYYDLLCNFSYMQECPIISIDKNSLYQQIFLLTQDHKLREQLHSASYRYACKYHSYEAAIDMFAAVLLYFDGKKSREELLTYYHPLLGSHAKRGDRKVGHPLDLKKKINQRAYKGNCS